MEAPPVYVFVAAERKPNSVPMDRCQSIGAIISLCRSLLTGSSTLGFPLAPCDLPADVELSFRAGTLRIFGLAAGGVCHAVDVTTNAVRSYRTISPLRRLRLDRSGEKVERRRNCFPSTFYFHHLSHLGAASRFLSVALSVGFKTV